jgi:hypothetical protein
MGYMQLAFDLAAGSDTVSFLGEKTETVSVLPERVIVLPVPPDATKCPLCRGHLVGGACEKCGMEVEL